MCQCDHSCTQHPGGPERDFDLNFVYRSHKNTFTLGSPGRVLYAEHKPCPWAAGGPRSPWAPAKQTAGWAEGEVFSTRTSLSPDSLTTPQKYSFQSFMHFMHTAQWHILTWDRTPRTDCTTISAFYDLL